MKKQSGFGIGDLLVLLAVFLGAIGWILNIWKIAQASTVTGMVIIRVLGVFFPPFGAVIGWF